ncbi:Patellin-6 [Apostasia shenzhenica]|uniref:Patellin-6 n=1 Tax=Apostasia shenzhenica TaxID=1088818 RepID=A0A2I0A2T7_9ASPA|nr:Patellin-6 [Apostasia shenzhenica]
METEKEMDVARIEAVLRVLKKQVPLTVKQVSYITSPVSSSSSSSSSLFRLGISSALQEKFCNDACIERFLKARGENVKKAAKNLRAVLSWRESIGTEHLMADEFSAELAEGLAYVSGNDEEGRPVVIFRIKQDYPKFHSHKSFVRLLAFTMEVAISTMARSVDQLVLIFDASFFRSASAFFNLFICTLKIIADYYPGRLHRAFAVDPPFLFPYLWKGARPFVELWAATAVVSSANFEDSPENEAKRTNSFHFDPSPTLTAGVAGGGGSASSRFSFTVSHFDSLKPWYLSMTSGRAVAPASPSLAGVSPVNARSYSFASPAARSGARRPIPSTPSSAPPRPPEAAPPLPQPRTPRPSFLPSPSTLLFAFRKEGVVGNRSERARESFFPLLKFYRRPYDEMIYRVKMKPPLGGLTSIVSPNVKLQRRHGSHHQGF